MSLYSQTSQPSSLHPKHISKQEFQLLNTKCQDIVHKSNSPSLFPQHNLFNILQWSSHQRTYRYNPQVQEATAQLQHNKNQLLRELQHSTYKRKIRRIHQMNGEQVSYLDHYNKVKPQLMNMKNTMDTETTEKDEKYRKTLNKYPELKNHPKLVSYISDQINQKSQLDPSNTTKDQEIFVIPCRLIPMKSSPQREQQTQPLRISQIIQTKYKNKYIKRNGNFNIRSNSEKIRTNNIEYQNLCHQQTNIIVTNSTLSKENQQKLSESLDRILKTVSPKKGNKTMSFIPSIHSTNGDLWRMSQTIKFPQVNVLIQKRRR